MYHYHVVSIGRLDASAQQYGGTHVTNMGADASIKDMLQSALDVWAAEGWQLHNCHILAEDRAVLIFEKWDTTLEKTHIEMG